MRPRTVEEFVVAFFVALGLCAWAWMLSAWPHDMPADRRIHQSAGAVPCAKGEDERTVSFACEDGSAYTFPRGVGVLP